MNTRVPRNLHSHEVVLYCDIGNGLTDAIWKVMTENGLKDAIRRSVDLIRDSFARACIPVVEEDYIAECRSLS